MRGTALSGADGILRWARLRPLPDRRGKRARADPPHHRRRPPRRGYRDAYAAAREIPEILDGPFCHCDWADHCGYRSLLTCYEHDMPQSRGIWLGEARTAMRLHGQTLAQIHTAIDQSYGGGR